jgi:hypothetical protein
MATIITKNSQTASAVPDAASLSVGELAVNTADGKLYTEHTGGVVKEIIPSTVVDGGITANKLASNAITTAKIADANVTGAKLENSGVTASTYGSGSAIPVITVDAKGRITSASTSAISGGVSSLNGQTGAITDTTFGAIGSYVVAGNKTNVDLGEIVFTQGNTYAGSILIFSNTSSIVGGGCGDIAINSSSYYSSPLSGTWRCMASIRTAQNENVGYRQTTTLYVRVS